MAVQIADGLEHVHNKAHAWFFTLLFSETRFSAKHAFQRRFSALLFSTACFSAKKSSSKPVASFAPALPSVLTGAWQRNNDSDSLEHVCKRNES